MSIDYNEVLDDLKARRNSLNDAIAGIESLLGSEEVRPSAMLSSSKKTSVAVEKRPSLSELIRRVAAEPALRTAPEIADRIQEVRPGVDRNSISTIICQLVSSGQLRKDEQLKVRLGNGSANGAQQIPA